MQNVDNKIKFGRPILFSSTYPNKLKHKHENFLNTLLTQGFLSDRGKSNAYFFKTFFHIVHGTFLRPSFGSGCRHD